jgi:hypothetical protein
MELQSKELRIGNFIENTDSQMASYMVVNADVIKQNELKMYASLEPIPLTEEWLLKFGFEESMSWTYVIELQGNLKLVYYLGEKGWSIGFKTYSDFSNLEYVHQLQNLYFALTGEELTLKP